MTPEKIGELAKENHRRGYERNCFIDGYTQCKKTLLEELELHIQINEHDWNRNPQAQLKDFIQSLNK